MADPSEKKRNPAAVKAIPQHEVEVSAITEIDGFVYKAFEGDALGLGCREMEGSSQFRFPRAVGMPGRGKGRQRFGVSILMSAPGGRSSACEAISGVCFGDASD